MAITIGPFLNAAAILLGALFGLARLRPVSASMEDFFRRALGASAVFFGLRLVWLGVNGTFPSCLKQIFIALLGVALGHALGRLMGLQKISNRLGRFAGNLITNAPHKAGDGFNACTVLFCAAPLGLIGAVTDGLSGYFWLLAVKAVMDALSMVSFVKMFRWPAALSAFPVFIFLGAFSLGCQVYAKPFLDSHHLTDSVGVACGFIACAVALVILQVRKVNLADFLPAPAVVPLLMWLFQ